MLFPSFRRWAFPRRYLDGQEEPEQPAIPASRLVQGWVSRRRDEVTVSIQFVDGAVVRYSAKEQTGNTIRDGFRRYLGGRLYDDSTPAPR